MYVCPSHARDVGRGSSPQPGPLSVPEFKKYQNKNPSCPSLVSPIAQPDPYKEIGIRSNSQGLLAVFC